MVEWIKGPPGSLSPPGVLSLYTCGKPRRYIRVYKNRFDVTEARDGHFTVVATLPSLEEAQSLAETYDALDPLSER